MFDYVDFQFYEKETDQRLQNLKGKKKAAQCNFKNSDDLFHVFEGLALTPKHQRMAVTVCLKNVGIGLQCCSFPTTVLNSYGCHVFLGYI